MLEKDCIQTRGFKNIFDGNGKTIGFQVRVRLVYYRGIWLSQLRPGNVVVDDETFDFEDIRWKFNNKEYTYDELRKCGDVMWNLCEPATVVVKKDGGLTKGYHDVKVEYRFSSSYMPPIIDTLISETTTGSHKAKLLMC